MKALILIIVLILWYLSYRFVIRWAEKTLKDIGCPIEGIERRTTMNGKITLFLIVPFLAIRILWELLKWAAINLFVSLPTIGKKNNYTKEDLMKMVDEYLNQQS